MRGLVGPLSAVGMGLSVVVFELDAGEYLSRSAVRRCLTYASIAVAGLVAFAVLRGELTRTVRSGSRAVNLMIGASPSRLPTCPCPPRWSKQECIEGLPNEDTIEKCWGPLTKERLFLGAAYLMLSGGSAGLIGLVGLPRKAKGGWKKAKGIRTAVS